MSNARNLSHRATDFVSVKDFGAKGDGTTDDGAAINAAIASLPTGGVNYGGVVYFPPGIYRTTQKILVPDGVWLRGAMGTITWGANFSYRDTSWSNPANGKRRLIQFKYRGSNTWAQVAPATGDM